MNLQEFRIAHSILIEHYQFIEMHLEGIYAALSGKHFYIGLKDVERYNANKIIKMIQEQERNSDKRVISDSEYEDLKLVCLRRNYWTHNCYTNMVFDRKTGAPKNETDVRQLHHDMREAEKMREHLYQKNFKLMREMRDSLI